MCPHCYKATSYKFEKPRFCSLCGKSYDSAFKIEEPKSIANNIRKIRATLEEEPEEEFFDKRMLKLSVEPIKASEQRGFKFLDIIKGAGGATNGLEEKDAETALRDFKNSGRSSRINPTEIN